MVRAFTVVVASILSGFMGFFAGVFASSAWERRTYPNDPDPVDFTAGAILLAVWAAIWLLGTAGGLWWTFRRRAAIAR